MPENRRKSKDDKSALDLDRKTILELNNEKIALDSKWRISLEPKSAGVYNLSYGCLLIPRFSSHRLTGDIVEKLSEWLPNICVTSGWKLEYLSVRPEYLQWVVNVPPDTSPGYLMRKMRQITTEKIFVEFPNLEKENPSGDFWAPGYLIVGGMKPIPSQLIKDYIKQIRIRQGLLVGDGTTGAPPPKGKKKKGK